MRKRRGRGVLGYVLYLIVGAGIFSAIELPYEQELRQELKDARSEFLNASPCVDEARLEKLLARVLEASNYGVTVHWNDSDQNWDFISSLFFTSTVLTTTGYGHTVPLSDEGKAFCIFYSLFGIPVTLLFLSAVVQRIMVFVTRQPITYFHRRWAMSKSVLALIHATCLGILLTLLFLIIPSWIFVTMEKDWNFLESVYFCFISLTTIGLGDYVPGSTHNKQGRPHPHLYRLGITGESFWEYLGLITDYIWLLIQATASHLQLSTTNYTHLCSPNPRRAHCGWTPGQRCTGLQPEQTQDKKTKQGTSKTQ
uniref:Potassium channel domain-containing protein n=1 Tax=Periophthalmus magnuspinnatus TaxID=409849 RepID=A0A3B4AVG3_9GOBI